MIDAPLADLIGGGIGYRVFYKIAFVTDKGDMITYDNVFNHMIFDGALVVHNLIQNTYKPTHVKPSPLTIEDVKQSYEYLDTPIIYGHTSMTRTIAGYLYNYMMATGRENLKIAFAISTRGKAIYPYLYGNYVKPAVYTVNNTMSMEDICKTHVKSIDELLSNTNFMNAHSSVADIAVYLDKCDFYFSNNRDVCQIKRGDGVNMTVFVKQNLEDIKNINKYNQHIINIGCFDGKWMIIYTVNYNDNNLLELFTNQNTAFLRTEDFVSNC
jgi:hypothetical protein